MAQDLNAARVLPPSFAHAESKVEPAYKAMRKAAPRGKVEPIAKRMGIAPPYLHSLRREAGPLNHHTGARNWPERLYEFIAAAFAEGVPFWDACAPLIWICHRLGLEVHVRGGSVEADRPLTLARRMALDAGLAQARFLESVDPDSPGGAMLTKEEFEDLIESCDAMDNIARDLRAAVVRFRMEVAR